MVNAAPPAAEFGGPRLTYVVKQLELAIRAEMDARTKEHDLTALQYTALTVLQRHPGMSGAQLSRRSFVSPQAGSEIIAQLERKGLIRRRHDPNNRRVLRTSLTAKGERAIQSCEGWMHALEQSMLRGMPKGEVKRLGDLLSQCVHNLVDGEFEHNV